MKNITKPIVLLHGALGISQDLETLASFLVELGYSPVSFNFSGHGKIGILPEHFRIEHFARDLDKFLKQHELKDVPVFGYSMGGYVALYHKVNFEDSPLSAIVTYGTKFNWSETGVKKELPMLDPSHITTKFPQYVESLVQKHGDKWKSLLLSTAHMMQNLEKLDGLTKEDVSELNIPVTLILGDLDRIVTTEETNLTSSWIPHSQVKTISHSKHELERTNLKELANTIHAALD